ncbi:hypothetical protein [Nocardioides sp.]|nr:hypothetical protein [Nocardioides sp.]
MTQGPDRFSMLPEPTRLEDTVTSQDVVDHPAEDTDAVRETAWLLRTSVG